jgi:hypothetical protein
MTTPPREVTREPRWLLYYADVDVSPELFAGHGAEQAALRRFEQAKIGWTCVLYREYTPTPEQPAQGMTQESIHEMCAYLKCGECAKCPAIVSSPYGPGEPGCYGIALETIKAALFCVSGASK